MLDGVINANLIGNDMREDVWMKWSRNLYSWLLLAIIFLHLKWNCVEVVKPMMTLRCFWFLRSVWLNAGMAMTSTVSWRVFQSYGYVDHFVLSFNIHFVQSASGYIVRYLRKSLTTSTNQLNLKLKKPISQIVLNLVFKSWQSV